MVCISVVGVAWIVVYVLS
jgi:hypothetical protein